MGAEEQVIEEGAMVRRTARAVGSADERGMREEVEERAMVRKERLGEGRAWVGRETSRGRMWCRCML